MARIRTKPMKSVNEEKKKEETKAPEGAQKGPRAFPRFCQLCKVYGHSDLICFRKDNAPTPGPSAY